MCVFFLKLLNMLREYLFCLQSFNLLNSLLCSFVGQQRWLGLILPQGTQSRSSHEHESIFCGYISVAAPDVICWEQPGRLGQVAIDLLEGPGAGCCQCFVQEPEISTVLFSLSRAGMFT